ncbi:Facilitated trehalose transporter Tret1 [Armadillidium vulgare]|nr:Facilitated trehalose transporter Tret1 [Armadillidium vulgare]
MIGCPIAGFSINVLGRRGTIIYSAIPVLIGWILIVFAQSFEMLVIGRLITGTYCSLISLAVPTYIAEFSSPHIRGILVVSVGLLRSCAIVPCICSLLMIPNKESPLYLLSKGREEEAEKAMQYFRGKDFAGIESEIHAMKESLEESKNKVGFGHIKRSIQAFSYLFGFDVLPAVFGHHS